MLGSTQQTNGQQTLPLKTNHSPNDNNSNNKLKNMPKQLPFHDRTDVKKNQVGVHVLYVEILKEYIKRLMEKCEDESSVFKGEDQVERFYSAIKYYYNQSNATYMRCVKQRQSSNRRPEEKKEEEDFLFEQVIPEDESNEESTHQLVPFQMPDLFNTRYVPRPQLKREELPPPNPSPKEQCDTDSNSDSDSEDMTNYAAKAERRTNCLLTGNFMINKIKRKPKDEKLMVELQNIFVKFAHNGRDAFFERGSLELRKIEKADVPIQ